MQGLVRLALCAAMLLFAGAGHAAEPVRPRPLPVVAAENFYGDVARQVGGPFVSVTSVLTSPDQDPHLFEASPSVARALSGARLVILNGIDYDPWMTRLLRAARGTDREEIDVGALRGRRTGDNPHIWYDPATMPALAAVLADRLAAADPAHAAEYAANLAAFRASLEPIAARIAALRARLAGTPVTATEPVFGYMFDALGMMVRNLPFQMAVMNDTEPAASDVAAFEDDLRARRVRLLVFNSQAGGKAANRMRDLARRSGVPVLGATETEPPGRTYQQWMTDTLDGLERALPAK